MPLQSVVLQSGVNSQMTLALNTAGVAVSNLIRFKSGLVEKLGGWGLFYPFQISSAPIRDIHAFQGLRNVTRYVAAGALDKLVVIASGMLTDITPQYFVSSVAPSFSVSSGSNIITVTDPGSSMSQYGAIRFDTPIAVGGIILSSGYQIYQAQSANQYTILADQVAQTTVSSGGVLPKFWVSSGQNTFTVELPSNGYSAITGLYYPFAAPTIVGGVTIQGPYQVTTLLSSNDFQIGSPQAAATTVTSAAPVTMNGGLASIYHYVAIGPPQTAGGYGTGLYGANPYGTGVAPGQGTAASITVLDWLLDNWGQNLVACAQNGPIYVWAPDLGLSQATPLTEGNAPLYNLGAFVAQPIQIMFAWGSCHPTTGQQDPLLIRWCDSGAISGYSQWQATVSDYAGSFKIPTGSTLRCAIAAPLYSVFITDVDAWTATYIGLPIVYSFLRVGTGCGALGPHCADVQSGMVFWAGLNNFFMLGSNGIQILPCTVWDFFFQQLDTANQSKVRCASNSLFNELTWFFPVIGGNGENQAYVKVHIEGQEFQWDYGYLDGTAWVDLTAVGPPIRAAQNGFLYQHEISADAAGTPINAAVETGYFTIGDGSQFAFVDWILPDAKWGNFNAAQSATLVFTFFVSDYAGGPERIYGPFGVTDTVPYINCRMRGRFWRCRIESQDLGSFWRIGRMQFRWAPAGKR